MLAAIVHEGPVAIWDSLFGHLGQSIVLILLRKGDSLMYFKLGMVPVVSSASEVRVEEADIFYQRSR